MHLDRTSPTPLYHQIAERIRYRIATGGLKAGDRLAPLKEAASTLGVHLHTVRKAYGELADEGLVETRTPLGTRVLPTPVPPRPELALRAFVEGVKSTARRDYGLSATELAALVGRWSPPKHRSAHGITVIECSLSQCVDLCRQIESRWRVEARPWDLGREGEPPPGALLGTYFHFNTIRRRWPDRIADLHFAAIRPDPSLQFALRRGHDERPAVILCERELEMASNIETDLRALLSDAIRLQVRISSTPSAVLASAPSEAIVLFSPRVWGRLSDEDRSNPRALEARYVFDSPDLEGVADQLGWTESMSRDVAARRPGREGR